MYIASLPFYPIDKRTYDIEEISAEQRVMMDLYPEIYSSLDVMHVPKDVRRA